MAASLNFLLILIFLSVAPYLHLKRSDAQYTYRGDCLYSVEGGERKRTNDDNMMKSGGVSRINTG